MNIVLNEGDYFVIFSNFWWTQSWKPGSVFPFFTFNFCAYCFCHFYEILKLFRSFTKSFHRGYASFIRFRDFEHFLGTRAFVLSFFLLEFFLCLNISMVIVESASVFSNRILWSSWTNASTLILWQSDAYPLLCGSDVHSTFHHRSNIVCKLQQKREELCDL